LYMIFKLEKPWKYLLEHGEVYTVRRIIKQKRIKVRLCREYGKPERVGKRTFLKLVRDRRDIADYVNLSGFGSLDEWWREVENLYGARGELGLYRVGLVMDEPKRYRCKICGEVFDTQTGRGKMHMAGHGYSLKGALKLGCAETV